MNGLPLAPSIIVDLSGSSLAIILAFMALRYSYFLIKLQPGNFLWGFLYYFSMAMTLFAISRGVGHILRLLLVLSGNQHIWMKLSPYSGGFNTLMIISVSAVTIYYHKGLEAYKTIRHKAGKLTEANRKLEETAGELKEMNLNLEEMVDERTKDLSHSEKKFRHFFENSKDMVYFCDLGGKISDMNPSGLKMIGYQSQPKDFNLLNFFKSHEALEQYMTGLAENGFVNDFEMELEASDGSLRHILISANAITDSAGKMIGCEGIAKDLTRLRTMTNQLISQEKMASVGQIAAGVAHEINTPLGVILGYSQLMMDDFPEDSEEYENLIIIERQTKACRKIVADLLKFSRQSESSKTEININKVIEEVLAITEHNLSISHIQLVRHFQENIPTMIGDMEKLRQVFINFINNAHHAMQEGGKIIITTGHDQQTSELVITFQDSGTGIPNDIKSKIFDPFFTTKAVGKGTGLGLSVTYGIIKDHAGNISFESPVHDEQTGQEVQGTAFHIRLPVAGQETHVINDKKGE